MKKLRVLGVLRSTALVCALSLVALAGFGQAEEGVVPEANITAGPYTSHYWARRALNTRYSIEHGGVAPSYHAGMLSLLRSRTFYGEAAFAGDWGLGREETVPRIEAEYSRPDLQGTIGFALPVRDRLGLGAELRYNAITERFYERALNFNRSDDTISASLNAGLRLSRRTSLGLTAGVVSVSTDEGAPSQSEQDGFWSIGLVWADPDADIWAGFRLVSELRYRRSWYYFGVRESQEEPDGFELQLIDLPVAPRTEGFLRAGMLDGRLLFSFVGSMAWEAWETVGMNTRSDDDRNDFGQPMFTIHRDHVVEYFFTPRVSSRIGYHRSEFLFETRRFRFEELSGKPKSTTGAYTTVGHGIIGGVTLAPGAFLLDLNVSYHRAPVTAFPWVDETTGVTRVGLHMVWER
ncbi:MAG: hypothetical protein EA428_00165 [Spirochaetaceae bacterium]|nr:MAG: hypothetical protein EA428_00165 [Spirochaetaceae bacterium]